jgi:hypothetical protein
MSGSFGFSKSNSKSDPIDLTPEAFRGLAPDVATAIRGLISSGGGPEFGGVPSVASGQNPFAAPVGGNETALLEKLMAGMPAADASTNASRDLLMQTVGGAFMPGSQNQNPFLQSAIEAAQRPLLDAFSSEVIPKLRTSFTNAGQTINPGSSSPFEQSAALASRGLANALGDIGTNMSFQNFEAERGRSQEAAQLLPQLEAADVERTIGVLQQQALPRLVEQLGIDKGLEEFRRRVDVLLQAIGGGVTAADPSIGNRFEKHKFNVQGSGGVGGGTGTAPGLSDRRLKENVERIGTLPVSGLPVYEFNYIGQSGRVVGVMADEAEAVMPEAVGNISGFRTVDYGMLLAREV